MIRKVRHLVKVEEVQYDDETRTFLAICTYARGSRKQGKRIGRGQGSGHGGTATRGHKGEGARSGTHNSAWFEGGQMPLVRRVPKRGFHSPFRVEYQVVNLDDARRSSLAEGKIQGKAASRPRRSSPLGVARRRPTRP